MFNAKIWDVIIVGGGPAGLSLGSELSMGHKVLVIDKGRIGKTTKAWTTEKKIIENAGLVKFITASFKQSYIHTLENEKYMVNAVGSSLDDEKLLHHWKNIIVRNKSKVLDFCLFLGHKKLDKYTVVYTTKGIFKCKLLVDSSGVRSKLAKKVFPDRNPLYNPVYGKVIKLKEVPETLDIVFGGILFDSVPDPQVYYEVFPISFDSFVIYIFNFTKEYLNPKKLKKDFAKHLDEYISRNNLKIEKTIRNIHGVIPMKSYNKNSVDGIYFYGDSGLIGSPFSATGFTLIIQSYKKVAAHLSECLKKGTLDAKSLHVKRSIEEELNRDFAQIFGELLLYIDAQRFGLLIRSFQGISSTVFCDLLFMRLNPEEIFYMLVEVLKVLGPVNAYKILPKDRIGKILKKLLEVAGDSLLYKVEEFWKTLT